MILMARRIKMNFLPSEEKPREKLIKKGSGSLSNSELLAIILRTGSKSNSVLDLSRKLFQKYNIKSLSGLSVAVLKKELGIGDAKACQVLACFELGKRLASFREDEKPLIRNAQDVAEIFIPEMRGLKKENLKGIYLDTRKRMIKQETIFVGTLNESVIHPREIFRIAIEENAAGVILLHNHPSGDSSPSDFDVEVTREITKAGEVLGIEVLDHLIIGDGDYFSLREKGYFRN